MTRLHTTVSYNAVEELLASVVPTRPKQAEIIIRYEIVPSAEWSVVCGDQAANSPTTGT